MDKEKEAVLESLGGQRAHVLGILEGLSEEDLRRPVLPSGWCCLALVRHLSLDVERFWFRCVVAGEKVEPEETTGGAGSGWQLGAGATAEEVFDLYRREASLGDAVIASTALEAAPAWWPDFFGTWRLDDLREIVLHVIAETACHAGHLDGVRELIDGRRWVVLT
jgi:hypothetical protein